MALNITSPCDPLWSMSTKMQPYARSQPSQRRRRSSRSDSPQTSHAVSSSSSSAISTSSALCRSSTLICQYTKSEEVYCTCEIHYCQGHMQYRGKRNKTILVKTSSIVYVQYCTGYVTHSIILQKCNKTTLVKTSSIVHVHTVLSVLHTILS